MPKKQGFVTKNLNLFHIISRYEPKESAVAWCYFFTVWESKPGVRSTNQASEPTRITTFERYVSCQHLESTKIASSPQLATFF